MHLLARLILPLCRSHHVSARRTARAILLLGAHIEVIVSAGLRVRTLTSRGEVRGSCLSLNIVLLAEVLDLRQNTKATLWRNQTGDHFLRDIFRGRSQQVLKLDRTEFLDNCALLTDALVESFLKLI